MILCFVPFYDSSVISLANKNRFLIKWIDSTYHSRVDRVIILGPVKLVVINSKDCRLTSGDYRRALFKTQDPEQLFNIRKGVNFHNQLNKENTASLFLCNINFARLLTIVDW